MSMNMGMMVNLTQHPASREQLDVGLVDLDPESREALVELLTFGEPPSTLEIEARVKRVISLATHVNCQSAMIGGAPWLMAPLIKGLIRAGIRPLFAFSVRESSETTLPDGSVKKISLFKHRGWVEGV